MIVLADTNILIGLLDGSRRPAVLERVELLAAAGDTLLVTESVLCEAAWVLTSVYGEGCADAATRLRALIGVAPFDVWDANLARAALDLMRKKPHLDIADCLLACRASIDGVSVMTTDTGLRDAIREGTGG